MNKWHARKHNNHNNDFYNINKYQLMLSIWIKAEILTCVHCFE